MLFLFLGKSETDVPYKEFSYKKAYIAIKLDKGTQFYQQKAFTSLMPIVTAKLHVTFDSKLQFN